MLMVRDLMRTDALVLEPEETLRSAVDVLVVAGTGGAPVVNNGKLVGVVSLSDVLAFEAGEPGIPTYRPVMAHPLSDQEPVDENAEEEAGAWFRHMWEDVGPDVVNRLEQADGPEWDKLDQHSIAEVMTRKVVTVSPGDSVREAARVMDHAGVHRLIVLEAGRVVGILGARHVGARRRRRASRCGSRQLTMRCTTTRQPTPVCQLQARSHTLTRRSFRVGAAGATAHGTGRSANFQNPFRPRGCVIPAALVLATPHNP